MSPERPKTRPMKKPPWLTRAIPSGDTYRNVQAILKARTLHTVCREAKCPNLGECFSRGTATFMILGDRCTRNCRFCAVEHGPSAPPDPEERPGWRRLSEAWGSSTW